MPGSMRWEQALDRGRQIARLCQVQETTRFRVLTDHDVESWALPVYVLVNDDPDVGYPELASRLRYRIGAGRYLVWLCAGLQRLGHRVSAPPTGPSHVQALWSVRRRQQELESDAADRVAVLWATSVQTGPDDDVETTDGGRVRIWGTKPIDNHCRLMAQMLDDYLMVHRGGWQRGYLVRTHRA